MPGQPSILSTVQEMIGETPFPLQIEHELPDFMLTDLSYISTDSSRDEEVLKIPYTADDYVNGIGALPFSGSTELVTIK